MLLPLAVAEVNDLSRRRSNRGDAVPAGVAAMLIVISLIGSQIVLQVSRSPEKGLI